MTTKYFEPSAVHLFQYSLASADLYYSEVEERDVFVGSDENGNFSIWGKTADGGPSTKINLCEIFLEYGMYCCSWCNMAERLYHMQNFGERLGHAAARYLKENSPLLVEEDPAVRALEQVFKTIGACFSAEYSEAGVSFMVTNCPLENTAKRSGLPDLELAHHGINAMCRSLILDINPHVTVSASSEISPDLILTITKPVVER